MKLEKVLAKVINQNTNLGSCCHLLWNGRLCIGISLLGSLQSFHHIELNQNGGIEILSVQERGTNKMTIYLHQNLDTFLVKSRSESPRVVHERRVSGVSYNMIGVGDMTTRTTNGVK